MMLLMISTALTSLAIGVSIAYAVCFALFAAFRTHVRAHVTSALRTQTKIVSS